MPLVGMKSREYYEQQLESLRHFTERKIKDPTTNEIHTQLDVGLIASILMIEVMVNVRDILLQLALSPIWWQGKAGMAQDSPLLIARGNVGEPPRNPLA